MKIEFLTFTLLFVGCASVSEITSRSPRWLGEGGGTTFYIYGTGFSEDQFNQFDPSLGNVVYFVNEADSIRCDIISYLTTTNQIVCSAGRRTNYLASTTYILKVFVDGVEAGGLTYTVEYAGWIAPRIDSIQPLWSLPGQVVDVNGHLRADEYELLDPQNARETGDTGGRKITKVYMGGKDCLMVDADGALYGNLTGNRMSCKVTAKAIAPMNLTVYVTHRGSSVNSRVYVDSQDKLYMYHTYPGVQSVTPSRGSQHGGTRLSISGTGFDPYPGMTQVWVGGAECSVEDVTDNLITCLTPAESLINMTAPGQRGLRWRFWDGVDFDFDNDTLWRSIATDHPAYNETHLQDEASIEIVVTSPSSGILSGYFFPPHDGNYQFNAHTTETTTKKMFFAVNGNPADMERYFDWTYLFLNAGNPLYFEVYLQTQGNATLRLRMNDINAKYSRSQSVMALDEKHSISLNPMESNEIQRMSFETTSLPLRFYLNGFISEQVDVNDAEEVKNALMSLVETKCEIQGNGPQFGHRIGYEVNDEYEDNVNSRKNNAVESYCGRYVRELYSNHYTLYSQGNKDKMVDVNIYPYMCFAIRGHFKPWMRIRFYWKNTAGNDRIDDIYFDIDIDSPTDGWSYQCIDMQNVVDESWISSSHNGRVLKVNMAMAPIPITDHHDVYVDEFAFVDQEIYVQQSRPSALKANNILISDIVVTPVQNVNNITTYDLEFQSSNCEGDFPLVGVQTDSTDLSWIQTLSTATNFTFNSSIGEVVSSRTQISTHSVTGTFDLTVAGTTVKGISPTVSRMELRDLIESALGITGIYVWKWGQCTHQSWSFEWKASPGTKELSTVDGTNLGFDGEALSIDTHRRQEGRIWHDPIRADFFSVADTTPHVMVRVNRYAAICLDDCSFYYDGSSSPLSMSVSGTVDGAGSHTVVISGANYSSPTLDNYEVIIGGRSCPVVNFTSSQVTCVVDYLPAGTHEVVVMMQPDGITSTPNGGLSYTVNLAITSVTPATGGTGGGYSVQVAGMGFPQDLAGWMGNTITFGDKACSPVAADRTTVTCIVPPGVNGPVDVAVEVSGVSNSMSSAFTYDSNLSATLSSVSRSTSSVLGGEALTISGTGFGNGTGSEVRIGSTECEVLSWSDTYIYCTLPSMAHGEYSVTVFNDDQGFASGNATISYVLKVTASSTTSGSTNGGTILVINGEGFGSNCSQLHVSLSDRLQCEVLECSDSEITCITRFQPKTHVISNFGFHASYGEGYAWTPKFVNAYTGDAVLWKWQKKDLVSQLKYNVFQVSSGAEITPDDSGITSGTPTSEGTFGMTFPDSGTFFFASDPIYESLIMRCQVEVRNPLQEINKVTVMLDGFAAEHVLSGATVSLNTSRCSPLLETPQDNCNSTAPSPPDADHLYFTTDLCYTPVVTAVATDTTHNLQGISGIQVPGLQVAAGENITLSGSGLGEIACQTRVMVGEAPCTVIESDGTSATCTLENSEDTTSLNPYLLQVDVDNRGVAIIEVDDNTKGHISVVPVIQNFSPTEGSVAGGTLITITGTGLKAFDGVATVLLGSKSCEVKSVSATTITCMTPDNGVAAAVNLVVTISSHGISPVSELSNSTFTFSDAISPAVTAVSVNGAQFDISGSLFGTDTSKVTVTLTKSSRRQRKSIDSVTSEEKEDKNEEEKEEETLKVHECSYDDFWDFDDEAEGPRRTHCPKVRSDLFDAMEATDDFWGRFTKTDAKNYEESKRAGGWRIGGTNPVTFDDREEEDLHRETRQAGQVTYVCNITSVTQTTIVCDASSLPSGSFEISVNIEGIGDASVDSSVSISIPNMPSVITSINPTEGSIYGGTLLTIAGSGFSIGTTVTVGGSVCFTEIVTETIITCRTTAHSPGASIVSVTSDGMLTNAATTYNYDSTKSPVITNVSSSLDLNGGDSVVVMGSNFRLSGSDPTVSVGGRLSSITLATDTLILCDIPDLPGGSYGMVVHDAIYGDSNAFIVNYELNVTSVTPATGGFGGVEVVVEGIGFSSPATVTVCGALCTRSSGGSSSISCTVPSKDPGGLSNTVCDVVVTNTNGMIDTLSGGFTYNSTITPAVANVSPKRGGTAGGTTLTISGSGFAGSGNTVSIGGSACLVQSESSTEITCVTEEHQGPGTFPVLVTVPSAGLATTDENGEFFYIDLWSSIYTWGGERVPVEGDLVTIEEGQIILLDESTEVLKMLLLKGGHMIVDPDATSEIVLRAEYILIIGGGSLSIGSEEEPYQGNAVIELYGNSRSIELPNYGAKVLAVREGSLELHGKPVPVTWTHLSDTAQPGDTTVTLNQPVTWSPGDQVVIASTERRFDENENEERTIQSVSADNLTLTLTEPLQYEHISIEQTFAGQTIETRAEIGLLTRNVKIRGAINEEFVEVIQACDETWHPGQFSTQSCFNGRFGDEIGSDEFGVTVMIFGKYPNQDLVHGRIEYVEVTEAGQAFQLGRYPLHFHLVGNVSSSYIRGCSVHRTYNRAITIHAADYLTVERNVVYNNMGHAIFTEDGIEQNNVIQYNLAVYTRTSSSLLNVDVTPSSFWVVNPNNIVRHNAAAGGTHFGYWYRLERHPTGPSATDDYCQNNAPMGEFYNNTAHSFGWYGLWVFSMAGYYPKSRTCGGSSQVATWNYFTVWRCERGAEIVLGKKLQFHNFFALDNEKAGLEMVEVSGGFGVGDGSGIFDSLVVCHSELTPEGCINNTIFSSGIVAPKKYTFNIDNTTFVNCDEQCVALSGCSQCKPFQGGYQVQVQNLNFENTTNKVRFQWEHETIWIDADGSLSGLPENNVVASMGILPPGNCTLDADGFSSAPGVSGAVCTGGMKFLRFDVDGGSVMPTSFQGRDLIVSNENGNTSIPYRVKRLSTSTGWMGTIFSEGTFNWAFDYSEQITNFSYDATTSFVEDDDYYYVEHNLSQSPDGFRTTDVEKNSTVDGIPDKDTSLHGDYYWDADNRTMTYIVKKDESRKKRDIFEDRSTGVERDIEFRVFRCLFDGCVPPTVPSLPTVRPDDAFLWSNVDSWQHVPVGTGGHPSEGSFNLPNENETVVIPAGMWLIVDTSVPPLDRVYVYGVLEFEDTMDHVFEATIIYIQGGKVIAGTSASEPFTHNLNLVLRGTLDPDDPDNEDMPMPPGTPNVGWKAIGVFGELLLYGNDTGDSWVKLGASASAGDATITLDRPVDDAWNNKQVMITTTSKDVQETEIRSVTAVSGNTLTLDSPLTYDHLGEIHSSSDNSFTYALAAEVGILTRNVVIEGKTYPTLLQDSFGGRILVSQVTADGITYTGKVELHSVELRHMGQEGFTNIYDPRYALAFHGLGDDAGDSYVKKCAFNKNFNTAVGLFGTNNINLEDNVIYHTVGASIRDHGLSNALKNNLVSVFLFPGTYNGRNENQNLDWSGAIVLSTDAGTIMTGNVVGGSEMAGYQTYGEKCELDTLWNNNEAHSVIYGVLLWKKGRRGANDHTECRRLKSFYVWRALDTAFYMQHHANLLLEDVTAVDCQVGVNQLVYNPMAITHRFYDKTATVQNSKFVGASPSYTCDYQNSVPAIQNMFENTMWKFGLEGGNAGILMASFVSDTNMAPKHAFHAADSYPALHGSSYICNVTFANFADRSCGKDVALMTNRDSDDGIHPIFVCSIAFSNTSNDNYIYLHEPNVGRVNPSDCVDMACDGPKKVVVQDTDGTLLGTVNATVTSQAEFEWNGDRRYGIGDYRIPVALKQAIDGSRINASEKFPNKGIYRDGSCILVPRWRAWKCTAVQHRMMVIESMDADTEVRRLSPIALIANPGVDGYVDLVNGPMDRGWCMGYTCQERISTFYTVVATGIPYEMAMTSTPPQVLRFHLLNSDPSEAVLLRIFFPKTQRYDVFVDDNFIRPTNFDCGGDCSIVSLPYRLLPDDPNNKELYFPSIDSDAGSNYLQREEKFLHLVVRGGHIIDIRTMPTVVLSMGITLDPNTIFDDANVIQNMAQLLDVEPENIRIANIIREDSGRKKRQAGESMTVEIEVTNQQQETRTAEEATAAIREDYNDLIRRTSRAVNRLQTGNANITGFALSSVEISVPEPPPEEPPAPATEEFGSVDNGTLFSNIQQQETEELLERALRSIVIRNPSSSSVSSSLPSQITAFTVFPVDLSWTAYDDNGTVVESLGLSSDPWMITVTLGGGDPEAFLLGTTTVYYANGVATFTGLSISNPGDGYTLTFSISYPTDVPVLTSDLGYNISVIQKTVDLEFVSNRIITVPAENFNIELAIIDGDTNMTFDPAQMLGQTMTGHVELTSDNNDVSILLRGNSQFTFRDGSISAFTVSDLQILAPGTFDLTVDVDVEPAGWSLSATVSVSVTENGFETARKFILFGPKLSQEQIEDLIDDVSETALSMEQDLKRLLGSDIVWFDVQVSIYEGRLVVKTNVLGDSVQLDEATEELCKLIGPLDFILHSDHHSFTILLAKIFKGDEMIRLCKRSDIILDITQRVEG